MLSGGLSGPGITATTTGTTLNACLNNLQISIGD